MVSPYASGIPVHRSTTYVHNVQCLLCRTAVLRTTLKLSVSVLCPDLLTLLDNNVPCTTHTLLFHREMKRTIQKRTLHNQNYSPSGYTSCRFSRVQFVTVHVHTLRVAGVSSCCSCLCNLLSIQCTGANDI